MQHREFDERKALFRPEVPVKVRVLNYWAGEYEYLDVVDVKFDGEVVVIETEEVQGP